MCSESELLPFMSSPPITNHNTPQQRIGGGSSNNPCAQPPPPQPRPPFSLRKMSCNGCRVLRKGCSENCILRQCLQWIESPQSQAHATVFVAKFFGRAGLMAFIAAVHEKERPALFKSLLYEACGRTVSPVHGAVGLLWTGKWHLCQAAVQKVLNGGNLERNKFPSMDPNERANFEAHERLNFPSVVDVHGRSNFPSVEVDERASNFPLIDANGLEIPSNGEGPSPLPDEDFDLDIHSRNSIPEICVEVPTGGRKRFFSGEDVCRIYEIDARVSSGMSPENAQRRRVRQRGGGGEERGLNGDVDSGGVVAVKDDGAEVDGNREANVKEMASTDGNGGEINQQAQNNNNNNAEGDIKLDLSLNNCNSKSKSSNLKQQRVSSPSTNSVNSEGSVNRTKAPASPTSQKLLDLL